MRIDWGAPSDVPTPSRVHVCSSHALHTSRRYAAVTRVCKARRQSFDRHGATCCAGTRCPGVTKGKTIAQSQKPAASPTFAQLGVPAPIVNALAANGKTQAFPIQRDTLPDTLGGRDVLGRGKTGSGKTLAFAIPMIAGLAEQGGRKNAAKHPRGLVLAPTRELATQIEAVISPLAAAYGMRTTTVFGGVKTGKQINALRDGVEIVVACPGRLEDLLQQGALTLDSVKITVLDEADHMADLGFLPGVTRILQKAPSRGQRLFFSATLDNDIDKLVKKFLHKPVEHSVDTPSSHVPAMVHHVFEVEREEKNTLVRALASGLGRRILFTRTKHQARRLARQLTKQGVPAVDLHGDLSQPQRNRNLAAFSEGRVRVLVATDVAARGVHVDDVELVVHVDPPAEHKAYLHRSGRTARAGSSGDVVTVMLPEQRADTQQLLRKAKVKARPVKVTAASPEVSALVGDVAPYVEPPAPQPRQQPGKKKHGARQQPRQAKAHANRPDHGGQNSGPDGSSRGRGARSGPRGGQSGSGRRRGGQQRRNATQSNAR